MRLLNPILKSKNNGDGIILPNLKVCNKSKVRATLILVGKQTPEPMGRVGN